MVRTQGYPKVWGRGRRTPPDFGNIEELDAEGQRQRTAYLLRFSDFEPSLGLINLKENFENIFVVC